MTKHLLLLPCHATDPMLLAESVLNLTYEASTHEQQSPIRRQVEGLVSAIFGCPKGEALEVATRWGWGGEVARPLAPTVPLLVVRECGP